ncbi:response regulator transcription factor [Paraburkholderia sp. J12]|uniref:response regulator transcription factor n=1 Tax=Paraburkholderia sp. J12 TaxID=2805432 RepID=UPI002ABD39FF|nr:response regulator transcription factor [Paraburkholderia sp. J12]
MRKIRIGIADDHPLTLRGLEHYLRAIPDIEICFKSESIGHLLTQLVEVPIDVLLCDYEFKDNSYADGLVLLERIRRMVPLTRVIFLSSHSSVYIVSAALGAGAAGFISKRGPDFLNLAGAIRVVNSEGIYLSDSLASKVLATTGRPKASGTHPGVLSERESTVVRMICEGMSIAEVAKRLSRSPKTVSNQKNAGMKKLGAKNDVELALIMREWNVS